MIQIFATAVFVAVDVLLMLNVVLIVKLFLGGSYYFTTKQMCLSAGLYALLDIALDYILEYVLECNSDLVAVTVEFIFMAGVVFVLCEEKKIRTALLTALAVLIDLQWGCVGDLIEMLLGVDDYYILAGNAKLSPFFPLIEIALFAFLLWLRRYAKQYKIPLTLSIGERIALGIFCFFAPIITEILSALEETFQNPTYNLSWVIFVLALNVAVVYGIVYHKRTVYYRELSASYRNEFDKEYSYFKKYKDNNKEMARFRHDWNNHMIVIQDLFEQGKFEEAQDYFSSLPQAKAHPKRKLLTGNETVDTIFAAKADLLEQHRIWVEMDGSLKRLSRMETVDICILFANLLDNAIEALAQFEGERTLSIKVTESAGAMLLVMKNPMSGTLVWEDGSFRTTKAGSKEHGLGLGNVQSIVSKYQGECEITTKNQMFVVKIMLPKL